MNVKEVFENAMKRETMQTRMQNDPIYFAVTMAFYSYLCKNGTLLSLEWFGKSK